MVSSSHESSAEASHSSQSAFKRPASFRILASLPRRRIARHGEVDHFNPAARSDPSFSHRSRCRVYMSSVFTPYPIVFDEPNTENPVGRPRVSRGRSRVFENRDYWSEKSFRSSGC